MKTKTIEVKAGTQRSAALHDAFAKRKEAPEGVTGEKGKWYPIGYSQGGETRTKAGVVLPRPPGVEFWTLQDEKPKAKAAARAS